MLSFIKREQELDFLKTLLIAKASVLDTTSQKDVDNYNALVAQYRELALDLGVTKKSQKSSSILEDLGKEEGPIEFNVLGEISDSFEEASVSDIMRKAGISL